MENWVPKGWNKQHGLPRSVYLQGSLVSQRNPDFGRKGLTTALPILAVRRRGSLRRTRPAPALRYCPPGLCRPAAGACFLPTPKRL